MKSLSENESRYGRGRNCLPRVRFQNKFIKLSGLCRVKRCMQGAGTDSLNLNGINKIGKGISLKIYRIKYLVGMRLKLVTRENESPIFLASHCWC